LQKFLLDHQAFLLVITLGVEFIDRAPSEIEGFQIPVVQMEVFFIPFDQFTQYLDLNTGLNFGVKLIEVIFLSPGELIYKQYFIDIGNPGVELVIQGFNLMTEEVSESLPFIKVFIF
jgi:hypothetical protein